jgi:triacylglycerol lipase
MGGLDARYMLSRLGMGPRALSLTTLGTPHRGTAFADWGVRHLEWAVRPFLVSLGIPVQAFYDLTTTACAAFNRDVPDVPGVRYFSVAARHDGHFFQPEWLLPYRIVYDAEGANDGVVSVASATYGEGIEVWDGDHLCLANWIDPRLHWRGLRFDAEARFGSLIRRLADEGF